MLFFIFGMALLTFSGWRFYRCAAEAGKNIEAKVGFAAFGVALFIALIEFLPKVFSGILRTPSFSVYREPYSYIFFLACGGLVFLAANGVRRALQSTPDSLWSDVNRIPPSDAPSATQDEVRDRTIRAISIACLVFAGMAGGAERWAGAADKLPFLIWLVTLPALAVWFGRRSATLPNAVKQGALFGAVFVIPSFLFYWSRNFGANLSALLISVGIPAAVAAIAFATRGKPISATSTDNDRKSRADNLMIGAIVGIFLPQFFHPAVLDEVRAFNAVSKELGNEEIKRSVSMASILSRIFLALTAIVSVLAILAAVSDAL
ncbi:MAG: hypothetical protein AAGA09_05870 [Pseudomonadota bacterium]